MISVTELLGTDSISASRIVLNDNFAVMSDEINSMETFFNPITGIIENLANLTTNSITIGLISSRLEISPSIFNIIADVSLIGNLNLQGSFLRNDINDDTIDDTSIVTDIGNITSSPDKSVYRVSNSNTGALNLNLFNGEIGQEIFFVCEATIGSIFIIPDPGTTLLLDGGATQIELNEVGQTVHLLSINDSGGNPEWVVVGGHNYQLI